MARSTRKKVKLPDVAMAARVRGILDGFDPLPLECDGFTRVASFALREAGVAHQVMGGRVETTGGVVTPHWWITAGGWTVDYRLRMWAGPDMPHGVFLPPAGVTYSGEPDTLECSRMIFEVLTMRPHRNH